MSKLLGAIVTGGAQGLGAAISKVLLRNGYKVCLGDIQVEKGKLFVKEQQKLHGDQNVAFTVCDVSKEEDYKGMFDFTLKKLQRIDLVVNNAATIDEQNPRKAIDVNLMGSMIGCQLALKYMGKSNGGKGGMVINVASLGGFLPRQALPTYCATKHAIVGFTRSFGHAYHLEKDGIVFAALCPSYLDTSLLEKVARQSLIPGLNPRGTQTLMKIMDTSI